MSNDTDKVLALYSALRPEDVWAVEILPPPLPEHGKATQSLPTFYELPPHLVGNGNDALDMAETALEDWSAVCAPGGLAAGGDKKAAEAEEDAEPVLFILKRRGGANHPARAVVLSSWCARWRGAQDKAGS